MGKQQLLTAPHLAAAQEVGTLACPIILPGEDLSLKSNQNGWHQNGMSHPRMSCRAWLLRVTLCRE